MRVFLFSCVVMVHTVGTINFDDDIHRQMSFLSMLMHYTRYGFVFVTLFVLCLGYVKRDLDPRTFWRTRFSTIVLPYLLWSVIYVVANAWMLSDDPIPGIGELARESALGILRGDAKYHLYFLLISMQIYLLFPLIRLLIRKTEGHHGKLLVGAGVLQMTVWCAIVFTDPQTGVLAVIDDHAWKTLPTYALFAAAGALFAFHFDRIDGWVRSHVPQIVALSAPGAAFSIGFYIYITGPDHVPYLAASALNPATLPWHIGAVAVLYLVAAAWNARRGDGTGIVSRIVDLGAHRAFGVFAVHPLVIDLLHKAGLARWLYSAFPESTLARSSLLTIAVIAVSLAVVEVLLRSPLSKPLVARPREPLNIVSRLRSRKQQDSPGTQSAQESQGTHETRDARKT
ncbi:MAG: acyltransferase [Rhodococcus sp.]|nr:acyltransferase [Rhodococcus sp. (in: high G+C Gram-positive bacteria)]